uniref:RNA-directed RNA polymerase L n=2 Tax=Bunyavirus sp. TaxID=1907588 RepID=A0A2Z2D328_9VIRU|nr:RNA-dependent RNA polymerase [Bunyavirus sp.]
MDNKMSVSWADIMEEEDRGQMEDASLFLRELSVNPDALCTFEDWLDFTYEITEDPTPQVIMPEEPVFQRARLTMREDMIDFIEVTPTERDIVWKINLPEEEESENYSTVSARYERETKRSEHYKIRHELVAEAISLESTDRKFSEVFPPLHAEDDGWTPDFIMNTRESIYHVVELTTTRSDSEYSARAAFKAKYFKYAKSVSDRQDKNVITLTVIVVTPSSVCSSIPLPTRVINDLVFRMQLSILIETKLFDLGFSRLASHDSTEQDRMAQQIGFAVESIDRKPCSIVKGRLAITDDFRLKCLNQSNPSVVKDCYKMAYERAKSVSHGKIPQEPYVDDYIASYKRNSPFRHDRKPVTIIPLVVPQHTFPGVKPKMTVVANSGEADYNLGRIWDCALSQLSGTTWQDENEDNLLIEAYEMNQKKIDECQSKRKEKRKKYHRVTIESINDSETLRYLQKDGICAKKSKDEEWLKERKQSQKLPFSYATATDDITNFLGLNLLGNSSVINEGEECVLDLIHKANDMMGNVRFGNDFLRKWMQTDLYRSQDFITDLATELSISIKQNTKKTEFILKKLRYWDCYVLIKPTNSRSHLFFSLFFPTKPKVLCSSPFRNIMKMSSGWVTDFCSVRADKLTNFLIAGPRVISLVSYWCDFYGISEMTPSQCSKNDNFITSLNLSILISLENKASTEEVITATRYMYMEFFRSNVGLSQPNPFKVLGKFPSIVRSRLTLWCIKNIINNGLLMMSSIPQRQKKQEMVIGLEDETAGPEDGWIGMVNLLTGEEIPTATQVVNMMYLGYLKDKNESAQENVEWKLVEKIVEEELKLKDSRVNRYYGEVEANDFPQEKEFSLDCMLYGCELMQKRLRMKLGDNWMGILKDETLKALARHLTHEIATLKASSKIDHSSAQYSAHKGDAEQITRIKVIEAIASKLDKFELNPMEKIKDFLTFVESTANGVICDLFKKNQHGGLREIYVLTIESRILQLFLETLSRTLCYQFEEETLTHPKNKLAKLDEHKTRAAKISSAKGVPYAEFCSSCDKTRWNQNFTMPAMSVPLFKLCDPIFHNAIQRIMNLWSNKLIKLPPGVCKLLLHGQKISSKSYNELFKEFHRGTEKNFKLARRSNSAFISPTSGMMQGILHYTSSLVHLVFLHTAKKIIMDILKKTQGPLGMFHTFSFVCSSDDSSIILSVFCPKEGSSSIREKAEQVLKVERHLHCLSHFCGYFNMRESVKSTIGLLDYVEYNSEFLMKNTIASPTIKFVAAALTISESESFVMRFHEQYNLISALYSQGFPSFNTHLIQVSQAILHYKTLGSSSSVLFRHFTSKILKYPDCVHGFFLLDDELACGLSGFSYARWKSVKSDSSLFASMKIIKKGETEVSPDGTIVDSLNLKHGDNYRWHKLLDRISTGCLLNHAISMKYNPLTGEKTVNTELVKARMEEINSVPELFFLHPQNKEQVKIKLLMKATMPGVAKSLSKGSPLIQSFSSTAYSLFAHCFTRTTLHKDATEISKETKKYSILSSLSERMSYVEEWKEDTDEIPMELIFPLITRYQEIEEILSSYRDCDLLRIGRLRQRKTEVRIESFANQLPLTLLQVCRRWWFGHALHVSNSVYNRCLSIYKVYFPWLMPDFRSTLDNSPFSNYHELYGYISSQMSRTRTVLRIGPGAYSNSFSGKVSLLVKKSPLKNHILARATEKVTRTEDKGILIANLELSLMIPQRTVREQQVNAQLTSIKSILKDSSKKCTRLEEKILAIAKFRDGELTESGLSDYLRDNRMGLIIQYSREQRKEISESGEVRWTGEGECIVNDEGVCMRVFLKDDRVTKIITKDWDRLSRNPGILRELYAKLGCKPSNVYSPEHCLARFDGFHFSDKSQSGTPIIRQRDFYPIKIDLSNAEFQIKQHEVGVYKVERNGRTSQVIAFKSKSRLKRSILSKQSVNGFWNAWTNGCRANLSTIVPFVRGLVERRVPNNVKSWCSNSLKRRLTARGFYGSYLDDISESLTITYENGSDRDDETVSEIEDWLEEEFERRELEDEQDVDLDQLAPDETDDAPEDLMREFDEYREIGEEEDDKVLEMIFRTGPDGADELMDVPVIRKKDPECFSSHPIWDEFIDYLTTGDCRYFQKITDGIVPIYESNIARTLMQILGVKEIKVERSLEERFHMEPTGDLPEEE